jgi:hypothetical protein
MFVRPLVRHYLRQLKTRAFRQEDKADNITEFVCFDLSVICYDLSDICYDLSVIRQCPVSSSNDNYLLPYE